jgi:hypothetical protein
MSMQTLRKRMRVLLGAAAAVSIAIIALAGSIGPAAPDDVADQAKARHYKGTRAFVVDKASGAVRMPTQQEVDEVVANLSALGQRPAETLQQTPQSNGAVAVDLDGGFGGILLARPNEDGTWETKCVFTLEEGAEFLGLVEDTTIR